MDHSADLLQQKTHFAFGKNWASYAELVTPAKITEAVAGLKRLVGDELTGQRWLDVGCGSGLHSLAALQLGAAEVVATDLDPDSVTTTRALLTHLAPTARWQAREHSVFDLAQAGFGQFGVVYSWGVLHHTGDLSGALRAAAAAVAPGGLLVFALYRKTPLCSLWKLEKRFYAHASPRTQRLLRAGYIALYRLALRLTGRNLKRHIEEYQTNRGMDFAHDVHDWMGGWPYESITPAQTAQAMSELGFTPVRSFLDTRGKLGLLGSGCDEYVYRKI